MEVIIDDVSAYNNAPQNIKDICDSFDVDNCSYKECARILHLLEMNGWTADYGLDGVLYHLREIKKTFMVRMNIGKSKYVVMYHNGIKKHGDNSEFYDIAIFKNKKELNDFIKYLRRIGYTEK
jgi:hypothetical protein